LEEKYTETPETVSWVDPGQSKLTFQFTLINAEQENISLMMNERGCYLSVPTDDSEYVSTVSFLHTVKPAEAKATFANGFLTVEVPFKDPLTNYVKVPVEKIET
jgi:HSP20 family molecular chaperone IbpA